MATTHIKIYMIVEDRYCDPYRELTEKIDSRIRCSPLRKNKTIPATRKLRVWIQDAQSKKNCDFVFVLVDLDTPMHRRDPQYFQKLQEICKEEGAALLIVKRELESWILADVNSIARWKNNNRSLRSYNNTAQNPLNPKKEIEKLVHQLTSSRKRSKKKFKPRWVTELAKHVEINEKTLSKNSSLRCFYELVKGCCAKNGQQYFDNYPQEAHCNSPQMADD